MLRPEQIACFEYLVHHSLILVVQKERGLDGFDLSLEQTECIWVCDFKTDSDVCRQLLVRLSQLVFSMRVGAVLAKVALLFLFEVLAHLRLVVVIRDVQHLVLNLDWKLLFNKKTIERVRNSEWMIIKACKNSS